MPGSLPMVPEMSDAPLPASRPPRGEPLRGRLPTPNRVHRKDETGAWVEDELTPLADVDDLESEDEFSAVLRDARSGIVKDEADLRRLAVAAMTDPKVRCEVEDIQSRLRGKRRVLELGEIAREEKERERREAAAQAEEKRRAAARAAASKLLSKRVEVMKQFDAAALELARSLAECERLSVEADLKAQEAGSPPGSEMLGPGSYERGLRFALVGAGVSARAFAFEGAAGRLAPLVPEPAQSTQS